MKCENVKECSCTFSCSHHGKCCECVTYHRRLNEVPGCFFTPQGEKIGDRSFAYLYRDRVQKNG